MEPREWYCGLEGKAAPCNAGLPSGHQFMYQLFQFLSSCLLMYLGKAVEDGPSVWTPDSHVRDPDKIPGLWFQPNSALAIADNLK